LVDSSLTRSRSVGSRSDGCGGCGLSGGGGIESGALDLDPAATNARERRGDGERRPTAAAGGERRRDSPANSNSGSGARFEARLAPTRSSRNGEAGRDGESGGDAAERPDDAAARHGNSGEGR
jgi:hypothetical protein